MYVLLALQSPFRARSSGECAGLRGRSHKCATDWRHTSINSSLCYRCERDREREEGRSGEGDEKAGEKVKEGATKEGGV